MSGKLVACALGRDQLAELASYEVETVKVAARSVMLLRRMMRELADAVEEAALRDWHLPADQLEWHTLVSVLRPIDPSTIIG